MVINLCPKKGEENFLVAPGTALNNFVLPSQIGWSVLWSAIVCHQPILVRLDSCKLALHFDFRRGIVLTFACGDLASTLVDTDDVGAVVRLRNIPHVSILSDISRRCLFE